MRGNLLSACFLAPKQSMGKAVTDTTHKRCLLTEEESGRREMRRTSRVKPFLHAERTTAQTKQREALYPYEKDDENCARRE